MPRFLSGELTPTEVRQIELHINLCDSCRDAANEQGYKPSAPAPQVESVRDALADIRTKLATQIDPSPVQTRPSLSVGWIVAGVVLCAGIAAVFLQMS